MMGGKATNLIPDELADATIVPNKKAESKSSARYTAGFQDIIQKHFLGNLQGASVQQVITLVSHSDGVGPWLDLVAPGQSGKIKNFAYCCTFAVELQARQAANGKIELLPQPLQVIQNS